MSSKRHQYRDGEPTKEFGELTYKEQAQSINATRMNLERMKEAHRRKAKGEGRSTRWLDIRPVKGNTSDVFGEKIEKRLDRKPTSV